MRNTVLKSSQIITYLEVLRNHLNSDESDNEKYTLEIISKLQKDAAELYNMVRRIDNIVAQLNDSTKL
jgi:hypothetical protein